MDKVVKTPAQGMQFATGLTGTPYAVTPPGIIHYFQLHAAILDVGVKPI